MTSSGSGVYTAALTKMEDQNGQNQPQQQVNQAPSVSFPGSPQSQKKSGGAKGLLIVGILILVAILGFVIYKSATNKGAAMTEPTPYDNLTTPSQNTGNDTETPTPKASSTPSASSKATLDIQVQNGTGIAGEAAYLQTQLSRLGYTKISVGNASSQNNTDTTVTFSSSVDSSIVTEITQKLKDIYQSVTSKTSGTQSADVVIVTGLRKGATAKPAATTAPTTLPSASPTATPTS